MAKVWRKESIEEMEHADKLTARILFLDGFPNMQVLDPLRIGQNVKEIIECDLAAEMSARALYQEAATYCHGAKDYVTRDLFEKLMSDEEHHIDFLETQLDLIGRIGLELYTQKHVGGLEGEGHGAPLLLPPFVMAGVVPAIHVLPHDKDVDARDKPGHDGGFAELRPTYNCVL